MINQPTFIYFESSSMSSRSEPRRRGRSSFVPPSDVRNVEAFNFEETNNPMNPNRSTEKGPVGNKVNRKGKGKGRVVNNFTSNDSIWNDRIFSGNKNGKGKPSHLNSTGKPKSYRPKNLTSFRAVNLDYGTLEKSTLTTLNDESLNEKCNDICDDAQNFDSTNLLNGDENADDDQFGLHKLSLESKPAVFMNEMSTSFFIDKSPYFPENDSFKPSHFHSLSDKLSQENSAKIIFKVSNKQSDLNSEIRCDSPTTIYRQPNSEDDLNTSFIEKSILMSSSVEKEDWECCRLGLGFESSEKHHDLIGENKEKEECGDQVHLLPSFPITSLDFTSPSIKSVSKEKNATETMNMNEEDEENVLINHAVIKDESECLAMEDTEDELDRICGIKKKKNGSSLSMKKQASVKGIINENGQISYKKSQRNKKYQRNGRKDSNESGGYFVVGGMKVFSSGNGCKVSAPLKGKKEKGRGWQAMEDMVDFEMTDSDELDGGGLLDEDFIHGGLEAEEKGAEGEGMCIDESDESDGEDVDQVEIGKDDNGLDMEGDEDEGEEDDEEDEDEEDDDLGSEFDEDEFDGYEFCGDDNESVDDAVLKDYLENIDTYSDGELDALWMMKDDLCKYPKVEDMGILEESDDEEEVAIRGERGSKGKGKGKGIVKPKGIGSEKLFMASSSSLLKQEKKNRKKKMMHGLASSSSSPSANPAFLSEYEKFLNSKKKSKSMPMYIPGEKKKYIKEGIKQKRVERMAKKGLDIISINKDLMKLAKNEVDMVALPPMDHHERLQVNEIAKIYRLKPNCQGNGRKKFVIVNRTIHTSMPNEVDNDRLKKILQRYLISLNPNNDKTFKGKNFKKTVEKKGKNSTYPNQKKFSTHPKPNTKRQNFSPKTKPTYSQSPNLSQCPVSFVSSGVIVGDSAFVSKTETKIVSSEPTKMAGLVSSEDTTFGVSFETKPKARPGLEFQAISNNPRLSMHGFGQFEAHTTGFGSKMMAKMGFRFGSGLGKEGQGISSAIGAVIRPKKLGLGADA